MKKLKNILWDIHYFLKFYVPTSFMSVFCGLSLNKVIGKNEMGWLWVAIPTTLYSIWYLIQIWFDDTEFYRMKFYRNKKSTHPYLKD